MFEEFSTTAIAEFDVETRFKMLADQGSAESGLAFLNKLDKHYDLSGA